MKSQLRSHWASLMRAIRSASPASRSSTGTAANPGSEAGYEVTGVGVAGMAVRRCRKECEVAILRAAISLVAPKRDLFRGAIAFGLGAKFVKEREHAQLAFGHAEGGASRVRRLDAMVQVKAFQQLAEGARFARVRHGADRGDELAATPGAGQHGQRRCAGQPDAIDIGDEVEGPVQADAVRRQRGGLVGAVGEDQGFAGREFWVVVKLGIRRRGGRRRTDRDRPASVRPARRAVAGRQFGAGRAVRRQRCRDRAVPRWPDCRRSQADRRQKPLARLPVPPSRPPHRLAVAESGLQHNGGGVAIQPDPGFVGTLQAAPEIVAGSGRRRGAAGEMRDGEKGGRFFGSVGGMREASPSDLRQWTATPRFAQISVCIYSYSSRSPDQDAHARRSRRVCHFAHHHLSSPPARTHRALPHRAVSPGHLARTGAG